MTGMVIAAAAAGVVMWVSSSGAPPADLLIPIDTAIEGGIAVGGEAPLATAASGDDLEGLRCDVRAVRRDEDAEANVGNDLIVESGDARVVLRDVERAPGAVTEGGALTLGPTISVGVVMGPDQRFAAAVDVEFRCDSEGTAGTVASSSTDDGSGSTDDDGRATAAVVAVVLGALVVGGGAVVVIRRQRGRAAPPS